MSLPKMTKEQREQAVQKASELRSKRAKTKQAMKKGQLPAETVLNHLDKFEHMKKVRVYHFLISQPGIAKATAEKIMESYNIPSSRRLQGLGHKQKAKLLAAINAYR